MNLLWQPGHIKVLARCCNEAGIATQSVFDPSAHQSLKRKEREDFKTILCVI